MTTETKNPPPKIITKTSSSPYTVNGTLEVCTTVDASPSNGNSPAKPAKTRLQILQRLKDKSGGNLIEVIKFNAPEKYYSVYFDQIGKKVSIPCRIYSINGNLVHSFYSED